MKKESILVTNIQRFSLHDGPGIRTTVFLKGCSLHCPWCSNPENINSEPQEYEKDGITGIYGQYYSSEDLIKECLKDKSFYEGKLSPEQWSINKEEQIEALPGGVTFSGGEPLLRMEALAPVISALHKDGVHVAVETCLFVPTHLLLLSLSYIDFFYCDIKVLSEEKCAEIEGGNLELYMNNLDSLMRWKDEYGMGKTVVFRVPVIGAYTDTDENRKAVKRLINKYKDKALKVELIKEHNLAEEKYKSIGRQTDYHGVEDSVLEKYRFELEEIGIPIEVCKI